MKKTNKILTSLLLIFTIALCASGCGKTDSSNKQPDILEIRNIAELATLECYYHNVAKSVKTKGTGITHVGEVDRKYWTEYTGIVRLGIDMSQVEMEISENNITITIPPAKVLNATIDEKSWNEESTIMSGDSFNSNKVTSEDITASINEAQEEMIKTAENNQIMLNNAQIRAKTLIENYINQIGAITGNEYVITWNYSSSSSAE